MTNRPDLAWYTLNADASAPTRLLDEDGHPKPNLSTDAEHALAALAAVVHATAWRLGERELRRTYSRTPPPLRRAGDSGA